MATIIIKTSSSTFVTESNASANVGSYNTCVQIDTNHFVNFWRSWNAVSGDGGNAATFVVNTTTWAVTTAASAFNFDTNAYSWGSSVLIDANHVVLFYLGGSGTADGWATVFTVNTTTWAITTASTPFSYDTNVGSRNTAYKFDTNHFINAWASGGSDGFVQAFTVNTTTWAVTTSGSSLEFDTQQFNWGNITGIDANHFLLIWGDVNYYVVAQTFAVNTSTWAITTSSSILTLEGEAAYGAYPNCKKVDTNHFIAFWSGGSDDGFAQILTVNTSTWAVTTAAVALEFDSSYSNYIYCAEIDSYNFVSFYQSYLTPLRSQPKINSAISFTINTTSWAITTTSDRLGFSTQGGNDYVWNSCLKIDTAHFIDFFGGWPYAQNTYLSALAQVVTLSVPSLPTVSTQDSTAVTKTSFTGNGTISNIGSANAIKRGLCYKVGTSGDATFVDGGVLENGSFGAEAFDLPIS